MDKKPKFGPAPKQKFASFPEKTMKIEKPPVLIQKIPEHWENAEELPKEKK